MAIRFLSNQTTDENISLDGILTIGSIANASTDTDKFLVSDGSVVKYRTGAQVRSDIGAGTGSGSMSSWILTADSGGNETVTNGESVDIAGGTNITTSRSGATVTITNGITNNNQLTNGAGYITSASLPSVGNGTLTINNGTGISGGGSFSANQSGNTTITITNSSPDTGVPAILSNGSTPSLNTGITGAEVRSLIGAGTGSGTMTGFGVAASVGGSSFTISNGETLSLVGGTNITATLDSSDESITFSNGITNNNQLSNGAGYITSASLPTVNNSTITFSAGTGLSGGGTITLNQGSNETITFNAAGSGTMSSWVLTADSGGTESITNGETVDIAGGTNITTSRSGATVTITNGITNNNQLTNGAGYITSASLPSVGNGTLSMATSTGLDGSASFTANQSGNTTFTVSLDLSEITLGAGLDAGATSLSLDLSEFTDMTASMTSTDEFIVLDSGAERRKAAGEIGNAIFSNTAGYITSASIPSVGNGTLSITGSSGISGSGSFTANQSGNTSVSLTNSDKGSSQNIYKNFTADSGGTASANSNNDTIDIAGGTNISTARSGDTITVNNGITNNNQLSNGAGYITSASLPTVNNATITFAAGTGLTGGGTITTNQSNNETVTFNASGSGTMSNWNLTADSGGTAQIDNGETVDIIGGTNITTSRSGNNVTVTNGITNNNQLTNGAGYTTNVGDITAVNAGTGMSGGGSSGSVTLNCTVVGDTGVPAILSNGSTPSLNSGITGAEVRSLIGAGTSSSSGVTSVATGNGLTGGTITNTGTLTMASSYAGNFSFSSGNLTVTNSGFAAIEVGGSSGALIDMKNPSSDDYDMRFLTNGTGTNEITTASGAFAVNTANTPALSLTATNLTLNGGQITLGTRVAIKIASDALTLGDAADADDINTINLKCTAANVMQLQDSTINMLAEDINVKTDNTNCVIDYGQKVKVGYNSDRTVSGFQGDVFFTGTSSTNSGEIYYQSGTLAWSRADADSSFSRYLLCVATGTQSSSGMMLRGLFTKSSHGFTVGAPLYLSTSPGQFQSSPPTGPNDYVRVVGYATSADTIYFNPDNTWVKVS